LCGRCCGVSFEACFNKDALFVFLLFILGRVIAQAVSRWLPTAAAGFEPGSVQVGFVVNKVALVQVCSEYFGFLSEFLFHQILHAHNQPWQVQ
jgi:hypothetical protein